MYQIMLSLEGQRLQNLNRKPPDQILGQAFEIVLLEEVVQVQTEKLEDDYQVRSEQEVVPHPHDIVLVHRVFRVQVQQDLQLHASLIVELLLVSNDL